MTGRKDPYKYVRCTWCGNIFRVMKSEISKVSGSKELHIIGGGSGCPECGGLDIISSTRREWKESNEVKPDEAIMHKPVRNKQESSALMGCTIIAKDSEVKPNERT